MDHLLYNNDIWDTIQIISDDIEHNLGLMDEYAKKINAFYSYSFKGKYAVNFEVAVGQPSTHATLWRVEEGSDHEDYLGIMTKALDGMFNHLDVLAKICKVNIKTEILGKACEWNGRNL